ncbi:UNVERIFIED_CONTAM: hypothetical protein NCL1_39582 [Trichonephila clavipes]
MEMLLKFSSNVNGKVIHVVQSLPPPPANNNSSSSSNGPSTTTTTGNTRPRDAAGFLLGAFTIPQDLVDPTQVQYFCSHIVSEMSLVLVNTSTTPDFFLNESLSHYKDDFLKAICEAKSASWVAELSLGAFLYGRNWASKLHRGNWYSPIWYYTKKISAPGKFTRPAMVKIPICSSIWKEKNLDKILLDMINSRSICI